MKAIIHDKYGSPDVLDLTEIEKPVVEDDQVLVRVRAASVNPLDWHFMRGLPYLVRIQAGLREPKRKTPGVDVSGWVEAVGTEVARFQPGDEVFGEIGGTLAEYASGSENGLALKPVNVTFEQASAAPVAGQTALQGLRDKGQIQSGQQVLINGASGGVGTFAVQIAKSFGAEVTGVCSTRNVDMVRSIGADRVIDYTQEDFTKGGRRYDLMFDLVGTHSLSECRRALNDEGVYVSGGVKHMGNWIAPVTHVSKVLLASRLGSQRMVPMLARVDKEDLNVLAELMAAGKVTPVIDRTFELSEAAEAIRYLEEGHARGKVVITV